MSYESLCAASLGAASLTTVLAPCPRQTEPLVGACATPLGLPLVPTLGTARARVMGQASCAVGHVHASASAVLVVKRTEVLPRPSRYPAAPRSRGGSYTLHFEELVQKRKKRT